jgi:hypothetical protein
MVLQTKSEQLCCFRVQSHNVIPAKSGYAAFSPHIRMAVGDSRNFCEQSKIRYFILRRSCMVDAQELIPGK